MHTHTHTQGLSLPHGYLVGRGRAMVLPVARRGMGGETPGEEVPSLCPVRPHPGHCTKVRCTCGVGVHLHMGPSGCSQRPVLKERVLRPRAAQPGVPISPLHPQRSPAAQCSQLDSHEHAVTPTVQVAFFQSTSGRAEGRDSGAAEDRLSQLPAAVWPRAAEPPLASMPSWAISSVLPKQGGAPVQRHREA